MTQQYRQSWADRTGYGPQSGAPDDVQAALRRGGFHQVSNTAIGSILAHWVGLAGTLGPIVIGELIEDPAKRWKVTRLAAVVTAVAYEGVHTLNEIGRRREQAAKLAACRDGKPGAEAGPEGQGSLVRQQSLTATMGGFLWHTV
jgi:hypothetical protein